MKPECRYCDEKYQTSDRIVLENELFFANYDKHPSRPGHMKLIPKRHVNSLDELTDEDLFSMRDLIKRAKELINDEFHPDGYNFGYNEGEAAGQTVFHLHFHLIPRYKGDVPDPTGGIRNIVVKEDNI